MIAGFVFFGGNVFLWGRIKLVIRDLEFYFNPPTAEVDDEADEALDAAA